MDVILRELFTTPIGLLAIFTIVFMVAMGLFLLIRFWKKAHE